MINKQFSGIDETMARFGFFCINLAYSNLMSSRSSERGYLTQLLSHWGVRFTWLDVCQVSDCLKNWLLIFSHLDCNVTIISFLEAILLQQSCGGYSQESSCGAFWRRPGSMSPSRGRSRVHGLPSSTWSPEATTPYSKYGTHFQGTWGKVSLEIVQCRIETSFCPEELIGTYDCCAWFTTTRSSTWPCPEPLPRLSRSTETKLLSFSKTVSGPLTTLKSTAIGWLITYYEQVTNPASVLRFSWRTGPSM